MKFIHTADLHIGQNFFGYERKSEHLIFFKWLVEQAKIHDIDALLIAGDVFDSPNPSADSQNLYYSFLQEITKLNPNLALVIIAGNHDSGARLEAPAVLLKTMNVHIKGTLKYNGDKEINYQDFIIPLYSKGNREALCVAIPYLRQGEVDIAGFYSKIYALANEMKGAGESIISMGHLHASGSEISDDDRSERNIIGGLECVNPENLEGNINLEVNINNVTNPNSANDQHSKKAVCYVALGHLHKGQRVSKREFIQYAGAPLPMSFAEKNFKQGVNLVEVKNGELVSIERLVFDAPVKLISIPKKAAPLDEVLVELEKLEDEKPIVENLENLFKTKELNTNMCEKLMDSNSVLISDRRPFLEIKILEDQPQPYMCAQIEDAIKNKAVRLAKITAERPVSTQENNLELKTFQEIKQISPLKMAQKVYTDKYAEKMPENIANLISKVIREVEDL